VVSTEREWFRTIHTSECWTDDGKDVGECLVRGGWATDYTCYSGGYYRDHETEAQNKGVGLWQCDSGPGTRRWGRNGRGVTCDPAVYKPKGPGAS
jgi:endonuclease YncB( thermonuclease family)